MREALQDPYHWFNMLVSDPKDWTHPWQKDGNSSIRESTGLSSPRFDAKLSLTVVCKNCGANPAVINLPDDHTDDSIAVCKSCRFPFGTVGGIKADFLSRARRSVFGKGNLNLTFFEEE